MTEEFELIDSTQHQSGLDVRELMPNCTIGLDDYPSSGVQNYEQLFRLA